MCVCVFWGRLGLGCVAFRPVCFLHSSTLNSLMFLEILRREGAVLARWPGYVLDNLQSIAINHGSVVHGPCKCRSASVEISKNPSKKCGTRLNICHNAMWHHPATHCTGIRILHKYGGENGREMQSTQVVSFQRELEVRFRFCKKEVNILANISLTG